MNTTYSIYAIYPLLNRFLFTAIACQEVSFMRRLLEDEGSSPSLKGLTKDLL